MIKVNDTVKIKNDRDYSHLRLWKIISINDDTVVAELISDEVKDFRKEFDKSKIQVYIKQNDEWKIDGIKKVYDITFNGIAGESFEFYNINEAEEFVEANWVELTKNLMWDIESTIEEGE
jgi:hypothetical protein